MCYWGDGRHSGQESGRDVKAWSAGVQTPEPGPSPTGPALSLWRVAAEPSGMQTALAGPRVEEGAGWLLSLQGCRRAQLPGKS